MTSAGRRTTPVVGFLVAESISLTGSKLSMLALPWLALTTTGSATATGLVAFIHMGCFAVVRTIGSPLQDRLGRRFCSIGGDLAGAVLLGLVPVLWHAELLTLPVLLAVVGPMGAAESLGSGAKRLLVSDLVTVSGTSPERLTAMTTMIERLSFLLGTPLAGVLIAAMGAADVLVLDAVSFVIAAGLTARFVPTVTRPEAAPVRYLASLRGGLRYVCGDRLLLSLAGLLLMTNLIDQAAMGVFLPVWGTDALGGAAALGTVGGAFGAGALVGSGLFAWWGPRLPRYWVFALGLLAAASPPLVVMAVSDSLVALLTVYFAAGLLGGAIGPTVSAVMLERVPVDMQARVLGFTGGVALAGIPVGGLLAGLAIDHFGRLVGILSFAAVYLLVSLLPLLFPGTWRGVERRRDDDPEPVTGPSAPAAVEPAA